MKPKQLRKWFARNKEIPRLLIIYYWLVDDVYKQEIEEKKKRLHKSLMRTDRGLNLNLIINDNLYYYFWRKIKRRRRRGVIL